MDNAYVKGKKLLCGGYSQYTPTGKDYFVKMGCYGKEPKLGSVVYFYSPTRGDVCHVGAVIEVSKKNDRYFIKTVEGNTSSGSSFSRNGGCVAIKEYSFTLAEVGGTNRINGFAYPLFSDDTCTVSEFVEVLKSEVGYTEKASNKDLEDKKANVGDKNFTKYGAWYGGNGLYWCQQFVSWCVYTACKKHLESNATGWSKEGDFWRYRLNGLLIKGRWLEIGGRWYVFDNAGNMIKAWFKDSDNWYYLNKDDGAMLSSQWIKDDGKDYYLSKNGIMARYCYIKDKDEDRYYWVDKDGVYKKEWDTKEPDLGKYELVE